jgi:hypothetical protein
MSNSLTAWRTDAIQKLVGDRMLIEKSKKNIHPNAKTTHKMNKQNQELLNKIKKGQKADMSQWNLY